MRVSEIEIGALYKVKEYSPMVKGCLGWSVSGGRTRKTPGFPAYWSYWVARVVGREGRRVVIEWTEPKALHKIPARQMRWSARIRRKAVTPSQIVERMS